MDLSNALLAALKLTVLLFVFLSPPSAAKQALGGVCTSSSLHECESACCVNGICTDSRVCFPDKPGRKESPCSASDVSQCESGCCFQGKCAATKKCFGESRTTMFVQTAGSASVLVRNGTNDGYPFELVLDSASSTTAWFADRPYRTGGHVSTVDFLSVIGDTVKNPVNAALVATESGTPSEAKTLLVELAQGQQQQQTDKKTQLRYLMRPLSDSSKASESLNNMAKQSNGKPSSGALKDASLFIDDCPDSYVYCCPGGCDSSWTYDMTLCSMSPSCPTNSVETMAVGQCWQWWPPSCQPCGDYDAIDAACNAVFPQYNGTLYSSGFSVGACTTDHYNHGTANTTTRLKTRC